MHLLLKKLWLKSGRNQQFNIQEIACLQQGLLEYIRKQWVYTRTQYLKCMPKIIYVSHWGHTSIYVKACPTKKKKCDVTKKIGDE